MLMSDIRCPLDALTPAPNQLRTSMGNAMTAFADLRVGLQVNGATQTIDADLVATVVERAGYVHPLFTDPEHLARSPFPGPPVPGGLLLVLLGGMAEQHAAFGEDIVALTGFDEVRFDRVAVVGSSVTPSFRLLALEAAPSGRGGTAVWEWALHDADGACVCRARARLRTH